MIKKSIFSLLLLCILLPSIQAELIEQPEQVQQMDIDIADKGVAVFAGLCGALMVTAVPSEILRNIAGDDLRYHFPKLAGLVVSGLAVYGYWAKKWAKDDDEFKKMFGRGALVGSSIGILYVIRRLLWYRYVI